MKSRTENGRGSDRGADLSRRSFLAGTTGALFASSMTGVLVVGCGEDESAGGAPGLEEVTFLTIIPLNLGFVCEILGDINGHFKKEGLKVGIQSTRGSAPAIQSILQGSALLTRAGAIETVIAVAEQGAPLVNIGMQWHKSPIAITSADEAPLETPADFRGKKIGIP
ncbi:MAG: ABC transporter substrate-binding protein, partial [Carbonactinosporaceae bacterium]